MMSDMENKRAANIALGNAIGSIMEAQSYDVFTPAQILKKISNVLGVSASVSKSEGSSNRVSEMLDKVDKEDIKDFGDHKNVHHIYSKKKVLAAIKFKNKNGTPITRMPLKAFREKIKNTPNLSSTEIRDILNKL